MIWGFAGIGLLIGGSLGYWLGKRLSFVQFKRTIAIVYLIHGGAYVIFSQMPTIAWACVFIALSRAAVAVSSVMNFSSSCTTWKTVFADVSLLPTNLHLGDDDAFDDGDRPRHHALHAA